MILKAPEASVRQWLMKRIREPLKVPSWVGCGRMWQTGSHSRRSCMALMTVCTGVPVGATVKVRLCHASSSGGDGTL